MPPRPGKRRLNSDRRHIADPFGRLVPDPHPATHPEPAGIWLYDVLPGNDIGPRSSFDRAREARAHPFAAAQQRAPQRLQPKIDEVRERLKDDKGGAVPGAMDL